MSNRIWRRRCCLLLIFVLSACTKVETGGPQQRWQRASEAGSEAARKKRFKTAERHYSRAVQEAVAFGDNDPRLIQSLNDLAITFSHEKRMEEARITYLAVLKRQEHNFGRDSLELVPVLNRIVQLTCSGGKCGATIPYLKQLLSIRTEHLGPTHHDALLTLSLIGESYEKEGNFDKSIDYFQRRIALEKTCYGAESMAVLSTKLNVARVLAKKGDNLGAEKLFKNILAVEQKNDWSGSRLVEGTLDDYRQLLRKLGRSEEAARLSYRPVKKTAFSMPWH